MNFISRWFSKTPSDLLGKGDKYMESGSFFDARTCFEEGLKLCAADDAALPSVFSARIDAANRGLAECNLQEAEYAYARGDVAKAIDHLELVKTLTYDQDVREKAELLLAGYAKPDRDQGVQASVSSCGSCSGSSVSDCSDSPESTYSEDSLSPHEYYELLIQQLPEDQRQRYAELGEDFAEAYVAAGHDEHHTALAGFENCADSVPQDIYWCEKGKVLHRLGNDHESEQCLRKAVQLNGTNSLAWLSLVLVLRESNHLQDALAAIDIMVAERIMPEQAQLLRADIFEMTGDHEGALNQYVELLQTPVARAAAERLYGILIEMGRQEDAAVIFKKYLGKSCH